MRAKRWRNCRKVPAKLWKAALFGRLVDDAGLARERISVAAISAPASQAAGGGWQANVATAQPRDDALLELAAKLCQNDGMGTAR